jgi:hypothetical protein
VRARACVRVRARVCVWFSGFGVAMPLCWACACVQGRCGLSVCLHGMQSDGECLEGCDVCVRAACTAAGYAIHTPLRPHASTSTPTNVFHAHAPGTHEDPQRLGPPHSHADAVIRTELYRATRRCCSVAAVQPLVTARAMAACEPASMVASGKENMPAPPHAPLKAPKRPAQPRESARVWKPFVPPTRRPPAPPG